MVIPKSAKILFQGDSITDASRNRDDPDHLGEGWVAMLKPWVDARLPECRYQFVNRGIGGNRVVNLLERWERDCVAIQPDVLSILVGVNDTWRRYDQNDPTSVDQFRAGYRDLLVRFREVNDGPIILCSPFLSHVSDVVAGMREDLDPKIGAVEALAEEFQAIYVDLNTAFKHACDKREPQYWTHDGVHPTLAGQALIAQTWLDNVLV